MHNHKFEWRNCDHGSAGPDTSSPVLPQKLAVCGPNSYSAAAMGGVDGKPGVSLGDQTGYHDLSKLEPRGPNHTITIRVVDQTGRLQSQLPCIVS